MAELLLWHRDYLPTDQLRELRGWRPGDVVAIKPDGHAWGADERPPKFVVLVVPDGELSAYLVEARNNLDLIGNDDLVARRVQRVALDLLPRTVRRQLFDAGRATITNNVLQNATVTNRLRRRLTTADR